MGQCRLCKNLSNVIAEKPGVCLSCVRGKPAAALRLAVFEHARGRAQFGLPGIPPAERGGVRCDICVNTCRIPERGSGYCGLRKNEDGRIDGVDSKKGKLSWYFDPLPTNCVGNWVCPAGTDEGFPEFSHRRGPEIGYRNLAVFFNACTFNCLYCQNWHFRRTVFESAISSVEQLVETVNNKTACVCYFGGDPSAQIQYSIAASKSMQSGNPGRIMRFCWETNGSMHPRYLDQIMEIALESGGCVKFDLKAWDENLHKVLTGVTNRRTLANFKRAGRLFSRRRKPPLLIASTLLVPGYIDAIEVKHIARWIYQVDPDVPYSLLAFYPQHDMADLPVTPSDLAFECLETARKQGLRRVRLGNTHLIDDSA
jgi:pyruvate formate lyase activating enzyme